MCRGRDMGSSAILWGMSSNVPSDPNSDTSNEDAIPKASLADPASHAPDAVLVESLENAPTLTAEMLQSDKSVDDSRPPRRLVKLPIFLFLVTCISTFLAGSLLWQPAMYLFNRSDYRLTVIENWDQGLIYMGCVLAILMTHEMGHFIATLCYRVPASLPFFIPFPLTPIGTMGAVIAMDGQRANRRQIFDIGIAGPLAGLVVAIPILYFGIQKLQLEGAASGSEYYHCPLIVKWMMAAMRPEYSEVVKIRTSQLNPYFMAGWVGLLITGLNMMPVSQLDGGHVTFGLFGKRAHIVARAFIFIAIFFVIFFDAIIWGPMLLLVILLMGPDHPPTADDDVELGFVRQMIGYASLWIPILCFPLKGATPITF